MPTLPKHNDGPEPRAQLPASAETWVREVLEPDQLSTAKKHYGPVRLTRRTVLLLWGLRVYVVLMTLLIGVQIWNALHSS